MEECNDADRDKCADYGGPGSRGESPGLPGVYMAPVPNGRGTVGLPVGTDLLAPMSISAMSVDGVTLEALRGPNSVCLKVDHEEGFGSMSCNAGVTAVSPSSPIIATELTRDGVQVSGFTADGVDAIRLVTAAGEEQVVPVDGNLFTTVLATDPVQAAWTTVGGTRQSISLLR